MISGDYKPRPDPTAAPFELVLCDLFVTEATFGLPVFRHEPDAREIGRAGRRGREGARHRRHAAAGGGGRRIRREFFDKPALFAVVAQGADLVFIERVALDEE